MFINLFLVPLLAINCSVRMKKAVSGGMEPKGSWEGKKKEGGTDSPSEVEVLLKLVGSWPCTLLAVLLNLVFQVGLQDVRRDYAL